MAPSRRSKKTDGKASTYEQFREHRIKENNERLQKLGIFDLALNLKSLTPKSPPNPKRPKSPPLSTSPRRSSRLKTVDSVDYSSDNFAKSVYDPEKGKCCHQCRQKSLSLHTNCSNCKSVRGQICGDCLQLRYGEDLLEVNENANWVCPFCRGICNCYYCRKKKGLAPIGLIHRKATELGFKSVAHYLSETQAG